MLFLQRRMQKTNSPFLELPYNDIFLRKGGSASKNLSNHPRRLAQGLRSDSSQFHHQVNFCFLIARHFIWLCKTKDSTSSFQGFLKYLTLLHRVYVHGTVNHSLPKEWAFLKDIS